jgi:hypothetical protein
MSNGLSVSDDVVCEGVFVVGLVMGRTAGFEHVLWRILCREGI